MVQPLTFLRTRDFLPRTALGLSFSISSKRAHQASGIPGPTFPQLFPSLQGRGVSPIPQQSRAGACATKPHVLQNPHSASLPSTGAVLRGPACILASTSASPPIPHSSPPHKLLSPPSGPSFQLVIGLRGQNCEMCLNHRSPPPTDAHLYAVLHPSPLCMLAPY